MTARVLNFIVDTNLFIQCRPLEELDWSRWKEFDKIHLIITRAVLREIDNLKSRGNDRVGRRARKANSMFRPLVLGDKAHLLIRDSQPKVMLLIDLTCFPDKKLDGQLDYSKADDEIVGSLHSFSKMHPAADVRLLTHDSGPIATALLLSLQPALVPDDWLLPPEPSKAERDLGRLEAEVKRLRKAEPTIWIGCLGDPNEVVEKLDFECVSYEPLTEYELATTMNRLKELFPLITDFGPREAADRQSQSALGHLTGMKESYSAASLPDIGDYTKAQYPAWIEHCERIFRCLHVSLNQHESQPSFTFMVDNTGSRPGKDVLIELSALGSIQICPPQRKRSDSPGDGELDIKKGVALPCPPISPKGIWALRPIVDITRSFGGLHHTLQAMEEVGLRLGSSEPSMLSPFLIEPNSRRDPNSFYYKSGHSNAPGDHFSFECEQWRHGMTVETFEGEIHFDWDAENIRGALKCTVHAENLSTVVEKTISVNISTSRSSVLSRAESLLSGLVARCR